MKKLGEGGQFEPAWSHYLCEYMMTQQTPVVRRQVRKLLLFICGHKDRYRQMRDMHALDYHIKVRMLKDAIIIGLIFVFTNLLMEGLMFHDNIFQRFCSIIC